MTVLIIEGPDLVGKSSAIEKLAKHFKQGLLIKNLYKPTEAGDCEIWAQYWRIYRLLDTWNLIILDRFYQSQMVYSILRGSDDMRHPNAIKLENCLIDNRRDIFYIQFTCPFTEIIRRYDKRGDEHVNLEQLKKIDKRYDDYFDICRLSKIKLDTRSKDWLTDIEKFTGLKKHGKC